VRIPPNGFRDKGPQIKDALPLQRQRVQNKNITTGSAESMVKFIWNFSSWPAAGMTHQANALAHYAEIFS
jgi:hypothetical protein